MLYPGVQRDRRDLTSHPENSSLLSAGRHSSATHALCLREMNRTSSLLSQGDHVL